MTDSSLRNKSDQAAKLIWLRSFPCSGKLNHNSCQRKENQNVSKILLAGFLIYHFESTYFITFMLSFWSKTVCLSKYLNKKWEEKNRVMQRWDGKNYQVNSTDKYPVSAVQMISWQVCLRHHDYSYSISLCPSFDLYLPGTN